MRLQFDEDEVQHYVPLLYCLQQVETRSDNPPIRVINGDQNEKVQVGTQEDKGKGRGEMDGGDNAENREPSGFAYFG